MSWFEKGKRQRQGDFEVGEFVAQDYQLQWQRLDYLTEEQVNLLITRLDKDDLKKAPKLILVTEVNEKGFAAGVRYKECHDQSDPEYSHWSFWIQVSKPKEVSNED